VASLEDLKAGASLNGLAPSGAAKVVQVEWFGDQAVKVTYEDASGTVRNRLVYRNEEPSLEVVKEGRPWSFDGDGALLRLVSEAYRIRLAHLFDPYLAIHTSRIEPTPRARYGLEVKLESSWRFPGDLRLWLYSRSRTRCSPVGKTRSPPRPTIITRSS
jgi:hypothetical protein